MATHIPESPDALLTRDQAAAALTESGFPVAPKTLAVRGIRRRRASLPAVRSPRALQMG